MALGLYTERGLTPKMLSFEVILDSYEPQISKS